MASRHIHFVTGRLAEPALRCVLADVAPQADFEYSLQVLPITVAALMTPPWIAKHVAMPAGASELVIPGYCEGDLRPITDVTGRPVHRGPRDLRRLPEYFGQQEPSHADYGRHDIEILAEINHAPRFSQAEILQQAQSLADSGADVIDVGCEPGDSWAGIADCVKALRDAGHRVSIDSFEPREVQAAVDAGAELVLSVNASNCAAASQWGCEVVVVPDNIPTMAGLDDTIDALANANVPLRIDPILEPIGCGFAASLQRYLHVRQRYPEAEVMMGIGNLTELTDCDSAAINVLLLGFCQELGIRSVLTTQVINWARTSVKECDLARRLVYHAVHHQIPPKHLEPALVMLRDPEVQTHGLQRLDELARQIRDSNYRVFAEGDRLHLISSRLHLQGDDPFALFDQLLDRQPSNLDASHAFYLGYELAKATTAMTLNKEYQQDEALHWGMLTRAETSHRLTHRGAAGKPTRSSPTSSRDTPASDEPLDNR